MWTHTVLGESVSDHRTLAVDFLASQNRCSCEPSITSTVSLGNVFTLSHATRCTHHHHHHHHHHHKRRDYRGVYSENYKDTLQSQQNKTAKYVVSSNMEEQLVTDTTTQTTVS